MVKVKQAKSIITLLALITLLFVVVFPFYWMFLSTMKTFGELFSMPPTFIPSHPIEMMGEWFSTALFDYGLLTALKNSIYLSLTTTLLSVSLALFAAYAIVRLTFRGKRMMLYSMLLIYTLPSVLLVIPLFAMFAQFGLIDSLNGLIIIYMAQTLPLSIYLFVGYFKSLPMDLEESALTDGCSRFETLRYIIIPLSLPAIIAVALYTFMIAWGEFLFALVFLTTPSKFTLPIAVNHMVSTLHIPWGAVMAGAIIMVVPVVIIFFLLQKFFVTGMKEGALKM